MKPETLDILTLLTFQRSMIDRYQLTRMFPLSSNHTQRMAIASHILQFRILRFLRIEMQKVIVFPYSTLSGTDFCTCVVPLISCGTVYSCMAVKASLWSQRSPNSEDCKDSQEAPVTCNESLPAENHISAGQLI